MASIPRGIYYTALRRSAVWSDQGKNVSDIPGFMLKIYERTKQPGLKPGLAGGVRFAIDIAIHVVENLGNG